MYQIFFLEKKKEPRPKPAPDAASVIKVLLDGTGPTHEQISGDLESVRENVGILQKRILLDHPSPL